MGAGLAGLAAARHLRAHGVDAVVLEESDAPGGRVRTDRVDGFLLDRGFQLYNPAYPEGQRVLDHDALDLRSYVAGAIIVLPRNGRGRPGTSRREVRVADPRREPGWAIASATAPLGSPLSTLRFGAYALSRTLRSPQALRDEPDVTAYEALRRAGADRQLIERLLRPFLSGVFLEGELTTSRRFLDLVLRSFVRGTPSLPAAGMQAIPDQLAVGAELRLRTRVVEVGTHHVVTDDGLRVDADAVIVATDPPTAAALLPGLTVTAGRSVTTWYHSPDCPVEHLVGGAAALVLDGARRGPLVNTSVISQAASTYAPPGKALVSSSALGVRDSVANERAVRDHLSWLYGVDASRWQHIATYAIPYALPSMPVPLDVRKRVRMYDGVYVAGDHRDTSSIQGALVSGRRAAQAVLDDRGTPDSARLDR